MTSTDYNDDDPIAAPYYDPGDPEQATRSWLVGHHLRDTLAAPLIDAAERQVRGDFRARAAAVTAIVDQLALVAEADPRLVAEMLVVEGWDTAMGHARFRCREVDRAFAAIVKAEGGAL